MRGFVLAPLRVLAVALREVRENARRRAPFVLRTAYASLLGIAVFVPLIGYTTSGITAAQMASVSSGLFAFTTVLQSLLGLLLGLVLGVESIHVERRNRTLGLVLLSRFRSAELVLGKMLSIVALASMVLLGVLPMLVIIGWGGGVDYTWLWGLVPTTIALTALGAAIGMAAGALGRSAGVGATIGLAFLAGLLLFPWGVWRIDPQVGMEIARCWVWSASFAVASQGYEGRFRLSLGLIAAITLAFAMVAMWVLPRAAAVAGARGIRRGHETIDRWLERINPWGIRLTRSRADRSLAGNPVAWMARISGGLGRGRYWLRLALLAAAAAAIAGRLSGNDGVAWTFAIGPLALVASLASGAVSLAGERARKSLPVLLATPLRGKTIVRGKMEHGVMMCALAVSPILLVGVLPLFFLPGTELSELAHPLAILIADAICGFCLCLGTSLFLPTPLRAGIAGGFLLICVNFAPMAVFATIGFSSAWSLLAVPLWLLLGVATGVMMMFQSELKAAWVFLARIGLIVFFMGCATVLFAFSGGLPAIPLPVPGNEAPILSILYLCAIAWASYLLVRDRFDDAAGRSA